MERLSSLVIPDFGLRTQDVKYMHVNSVVRGRGPERLKYLDLEGRWLLSGSSIPYISATFNHLQRLNDAQLPMRDMSEQPLNAIGMVGWAKSSQDVERDASRSSRDAYKSMTLPRRSTVITRSRSPVRIEEQPPSPREEVPYRSAGYGEAHIKRKLSVSEASPRSRSASPIKVTTDYDRSSRRDPGYGSASPSPRDNDLTDPYRPPHRTQGLSSRPASRTRLHDSDYDDTYLRTENENSRNYSDELRVMTGGRNASRNASRDIYREKRHYSVSPRSLAASSPRSLGSAGEDLGSGSEFGSPRPRDRSFSRGRSAGGKSTPPPASDEVIMMSYQMKKTSTTGSPGTYRRNWIRT